MGAIALFFSPSLSRWIYSGGFQGFQRQGVLSRRGGYLFHPLDIEIARKTSGGVKFSCKDESGWMGDNRLIHAIRMAGHLSGISVDAAVM